DPKEVLDFLRNPPNSVEIYAGVDSHFLEEVNHVLSWDVAHPHYRDRHRDATPVATDAGFEDRRTVFVRSKDIGKSHPSPIVQMNTQFQLGPATTDAPNALSDKSWISHSDAVSHRDLTDSHLDE